MRIIDSKSNGRITCSSIIGALEVQLQVLNGLILRETKTRYGRHKLGFFWMFIEPAVFVGLFLAFTLLLQTSSLSSMPDVYFIISGVTPFFLFRQTMTTLGSSIVGSRSLLVFPQVTTFDVILATVLLEFATVFLVFTVMVLGATVFYGPPNIENPLIVIYGTCLLGITGSGLGMIFASIVPIMPAVKNVAAPFLGRPLLFTSGIFFTADMLPEAGREVMLYNPLLHMIEIIRSGFFIEFESQYADWHYATMFAAGLFLLGLLMHQALKDQVIKLA